MEEEKKKTIEDVDPEILLYAEEIAIRHGLKPHCYAISKGHKTGIVYTLDELKEGVNGLKKGETLWKSFKSEKDAAEFLVKHGEHLTDAKVKFYGVFQGFYPGVYPSREAAIQVSREEPREFYTEKDAMVYSMTGKYPGGMDVKTLSEDTFWRSKCPEFSGQGEIVQVYLSWNLEGYSYQVGDYTDGIITEYVNDDSILKKATFNEKMCEIGARALLNIFVKVFGVDKKKGNLITAKEGYLYVICAKPQLITALKRYKTPTSMQARIKSKINTYPFVVVYNPHHLVFQSKISPDSQ
jgi:viroplasmin and RNaseH domain-containing protein